MTAIRCPNCGTKYSRVDISNCEVCGFKFIQSAQRSREITSPSPEISILNDPGRLFESQELYVYPENHRKKHIFHNKPQLEGTVVAVDGPYLEPPDLDVPGVLLKLFLFLLLMPILIVILVIYAAFSIPLSILGLGKMATSMNPLNMLIALGLFKSLFGLRSNKGIKDVPVRFYYLEDSFGNEYTLRVKGHLRAGSVAPGHPIVVWGKWRDGVLHVKKAYNQRTRSNMIVQDNRWKWVLVGIIIFIIAMFLLSFNSI